MSKDELGPGLSRLLGQAALLLNEVQDARAYFESAIEAARRARNRPEFALSSLHAAELILDHYADERAEAVEYLDFAMREFEEMKMQPALERAAPPCVDTLPRQRHDRGTVTSERVRREI